MYRGMAAQAVRMWLCAVWVERASPQEMFSIAQGRLRGVLHDGYESYVGIPYASVTDHAHRFRRAGLAPSWDEVRESRAPRSSCSSTGEDCLQLDMHVPTGAAAGGEPWPVLVWVQSGTGQYHPGMFVKQGIIVVNVNYRFGPMGFLCFDDERIPGNTGAKDLVLALRWVRDNINAFRGNPARVVVGGQSFGAAMVEGLLLSPMSEGLFSGAIMQSGSVLSPWAFNYDAVERAKELARKFTKSEDKADMVSALLNAAAIDLVNEAKEIRLAYFPFAMCAERPFENEERFLSEPPLTSLRNRRVHRVPVMMGYNNDEGYIFTSHLEDNDALGKLSKGVAFLLTEELESLNEDEKIVHYGTKSHFMSKCVEKEVIEQIEDRYFSNNRTMEALLAYHRDVYFVQHILRSARLHMDSNELPVYLYQFSHAGAPGVETRSEFRKSGAAHSDELAYLFPEGGKEYEGEDGAVQQKMVNIWTNFVKYLDPTPRSEQVLAHWEPLRAGELRVYNIGPDVELREFPYTREIQMLDNIYDKYYYPRQTITINLE